MATIVSDPDEIRSMIGQEVESNMRRIFREFGFTVKNDISQQENVWLNLEDAKLILPIKSRKKWKALRDSAEINFAKAGRGFVYQKSSLYDYLLNNSTLPKPKRNEKTKKN